MKCALTDCRFEAKTLYILNVGLKFKNVSLLHYPINSNDPFFLVNSEFILNSFNLFNFWKSSFV